MVALTSGPDTPFKVSGQVHPGYVHSSCDFPLWPSLLFISPGIPSLRKQTDKITES